LIKKRECGIGETDVKNPEGQEYDKIGAAQRTWSRFYLRFFAIFERGLGPSGQQSKNPNLPPPERMKYEHRCEEPISQEKSCYAKKKEGNFLHRRGDGRMERYQGRKNSAKKRERRGRRRGVIDGSF